MGNVAQAFLPVSVVGQEINDLFAIEKADGECCFVAKGGAERLLKQAR